VAVFFPQFSADDPANSAVGGKFAIAPDSFNDMTILDCLPPSND
jgi:hypothetical protein